MHTHTHTQKHVNAQKHTFIRNVLEEDQKGKLMKRSERPSQEAEN